MQALQERQAAAEEAHGSGDGDDLAAVNEALRAALEGTRQELFDVYQQVTPIRLLQDRVL